MAKQEIDNKGQAQPKREKRGNYDDKLVVTGFFFDVMKASVNDADNKTSTKKDEQEDEDILLDNIGHFSYC